MFDPPASPTNGAEFTYGNVVWQYQNPPGVWNIKDGTLVGTDGVGVSGFFVAQEGSLLTDGHLYFYYVYSDGATSDLVDAGSVITQANTVPADPGITFTDSFASGTRVELGETVVLTGQSGSIIVRRDGGVSNTFRFDTRMASDSLTGVASFDNAHFTVSGVGQVSLVSGITGDTVTGPNAAITVSKSGKVATIDARLATESLTGVARFSSSYFDVTGGLVTLTSSYQATGDTVTGPNAAITVSKSGKVATIDARLATNTGTTGVAGFTGADFNVLKGVVSLTAGIVRSVNGVTGEVAKGTPENRVFYSNTAKGLTTSDKFLFDGTSLTFSGTDFNLGSANMIGGVFFKNKEKGSTRTLNNNNVLTIDPADGHYQKIKWNTSTEEGPLLVQAGTQNWSQTANQVESVVAVILQVGKGLSAQFATSVLNEGNRYFMGSTGSVDVITISRYAIDSSNGLTMGFIIARGMTSGGFKFE